MTKSKKRTAALSSKPSKRLLGQGRPHSQCDSALREAEHRSAAAASPENAGGAPAESDQVANHDQPKSDRNRASTVAPSPIKNTGIPAETKGSGHSEAQPQAPATLSELLREIAYSLKAFSQKQRPGFEWAGGIPAKLRKPAPKESGREIWPAVAVKSGREIWVGFGNLIISPVEQVELRVSEIGDADLRRRALILMSDLHCRFDSLASDEQLLIDGKPPLVNNNPIDRDEFPGHRPEFERAADDLFRPLMQLSHEFAADARLKSGVNNGDAAPIGAPTENNTRATDKPASARRGRLTKEQSEALRATMNAEMDADPNLSADAQKLAKLADTSESSARRFIKKRNKECRNK